MDNQNTQTNITQPRSIEIQKKRFIAILHGIAFLPLFILIFKLGTSIFAALEIRPADDLGINILNAVIVLPVIAIAMRVWNHIVPDTFRLHSSKAWWLNLLWGLGWGFVGQLMLVVLQEGFLE